VDDDILEVVSVQVAHLQAGDILSCSRTGVIVGRVQSIVGMVITITLDLVLECCRETASKRRF
jgi:hypothetical protein